MASPHGAVYMKKTKFRSITIVALMLVFAIVFGFALSLFAPGATAYAVAPTSIFSSGTGGRVGSSEEDEEGNAYVQFTLSDGGEVYFRRDLALKWFAAVPGTQDDTEEGEAAQQSDTALANPGQAEYLSISLTFPEINFSVFSFVFESAEENITEENTAENSIVLLNTGDQIYAGVRNASMQDDDLWANTVARFTDPESAGGEYYEEAEFVSIELVNNLSIALSEEYTDAEGALCTTEGGEFAVYVNQTYVGNMTNVGANFLEYLSTASSTPRVPLGFVADELLDGESEQLVLMKELNKQTFELDESNQVTDNAAPVLVLNESIYAYTLGSRWSLSYEAIDVIDSSVTVNRYYYMLKADENGNYLLPVDDDYSTLTTSTVFMPTDDTSEEEEQYVSIRFQLTDDAGTSDDEDSYIYLSWYAVESAVATCGEGENAFDYIRVNRHDEGPYYIGVTANDETKANDVSPEAENAFAEYQEAVTAAAEGLSAGDGAYFYMPSLRNLIGSDHADYRNLSFTVYYYKQSQEVDSTATSAASLDYNELRFEVDEVGQYLFCVVATDASDNEMEYYLDGELVALTSTNVWEIDEIPKFSFSASYSGATVEDPGEQTQGYRDSNYSISDFEIVALSGYETEYNLYYLDEAAMQEELTTNPFSSYSDLVENFDEYYDTISEYLIRINEYNSDITEDDDAWDRTDNDYRWYPDSLTFTPVQVGFYVVELRISESVLPGNIVTAYQVIEVRNPTDTPPNETEWLENNIASVVLFSISGVLLIVIIVLLVTKSPEQAVDEVDLEKLKKAERKKKNVAPERKDKDQNE